MFLDTITTYSQHVSTLWNWILPHTCVVCGMQTHRAVSICLPCQQELPILTENCLQCAGLILRPAANLSITHEERCVSCLHENMPFDRTYALFRYQQAIEKLIVELKFNQQVSHAHLLGNLMLERIQQDWYKNQPLPDVLIPVPLHPNRLRERGYNQAVEIARPVAKTLRIPLAIQGVARSRHTERQSNLDAVARRQNLTGAFAVTADYAGKLVAVIDDVITTGSTVTELCRVLKKHKVRAIHVWCCARR